MKLINKMLIIVLFSYCALSFVSCKEEEVDNTKSYITLSINPEIEMVLNSDYEVTTINGLNDDGEMLIVDEEIVGKQIDEVLEFLVNQAYGCGYLTPSKEANPVQNNIKVSINSTDSKDLNKLEINVKNQLEKIIKKEDINAKVERIESKKRDYFISIVKHYNPSLTDDVISKMSEEELMMLVELATIEKAELCSIELEKYYLTLKEYEFQIKYKEQVAKKLELLSSVTSTVYKAAINSLKDAIEQINKLQYKIFVSQDSLYIKLLDELNSYKDKNLVLKYMLVNESTEESNEITIEIETNKAKISEIESEIIKIMTAFNNELEVIKKTLNSAITILSEQEKNISNINYNEIMINVEKIINNEKDGLMTKFEEQYSKDIASVKEKINKRKASLESNFNK